MQTLDFSILNHYILPIIHAGICCGDLPRVANGKIEIHPDTKLGSSAVYTCNPGYILEGNTKRTCLANGKWSGSKPACTRKFKLSQENCFSSLCSCHVWPS